MSVRECAFWLLTIWNVPLYQDIAFILYRDYVRDNVVIIADLCKVTQRDKHIRENKTFSVSYYESSFSVIKASVQVLPVNAFI